MQNHDAGEPTRAVVNSGFLVLKGLVESVENGKSWSETYFECAGKRMTKDSEQTSEDIPNGY